MIQLIRIKSSACVESSFSTSVSHKLPPAPPECTWKARRYSLHRAYRSLGTVGWWLGSRSKYFTRQQQGTNSPLTEVITCIVSSSWRLEFLSSLCSLISNTVLCIYLLYHCCTDLLSNLDFIGVWVVFIEFFFNHFQQFGGQGRVKDGSLGVYY